MEPSSRACRPPVASEATAASVAPALQPATGEQLERLRRRARERGVNRLVYGIVRALLVPFFRVYFRLEGIGCEHLPRSGPVLVAANHRSFLDPFVIGALARRPIYYVAKRELFANRLQAWLLSALGAFPVDRGASDEEALATARAILARGDCVVIFPEGTRVRRGPLGPPRRGAGRVALETGARVVPVAVIGTDAVRRGWWIRPRKVRIRCGAPLGFPTVTDVSPALAAAVTERVWACVGLQWEWLGGAPRVEVASRRPERAASPAAREAGVASPAIREAGVAWTATAEAGVASPAAREAGVASPATPEACAALPATEEARAA